MVQVIATGEGYGLLEHLQHQQHNGDHLQGDHADMTVFFAQPQTKQNAQDQHHADAGQKGAQMGRGPKLHENASLNLSGFVIPIIALRPHLVNRITKNFISLNFHGFFVVEG